MRMLGVLRVAGVKRWFFLKAYNRKASRGTAHPHSGRVVYSLILKKYIVFSVRIFFYPFLCRQRQISNEKTGTLLIPLLGVAAKPTGWFGGKDMKNMV